jgi:hypothetical protein
MNDGKNEKIEKFLINILGRLDYIRKKYFSFINVKFN